MLYMYIYICIYIYVYIYMIHIIYISTYDTYILYIYTLNIYIYLHMMTNMIYGSVTVCLKTSNKNRQFWPFCFNGIFDDNPLDLRLILGQTWGFCRG